MDLGERYGGLTPTLPQIARKTMPLEILHYPHPALRHISRPLARVDAELRLWIDEMLELMYGQEGVGLAANQVGLPYRFFVMNAEGDRDATEAEHVFINPVLSAGKGTVEAEEGCLSIPEVYAPVVRKERIRLQAYNLRGEEIVVEVDGFFARVVQHEADHLDGTLFIDRLTATRRADIRDQLAEFELAFASKCETGEMPTDATIAARLAELETART